MMILSGSESSAPVKPPSKWRERLGWAAPVALAAFVVCSGCFMLFALVLTARDELEAPALGSDWRIWQLRERGTNGIGVSQASAFTSATGQACRSMRVWLITWRPAVRIEMSAYEDCARSNVQSA
ncbi:MAG TPA: hypothetical protein VJG32_17425 [Anaerolineae bacterium]|nr:hypothetical protein [Anaerolineae bacterium]